MRVIPVAMALMLATPAAMSLELRSGTCEVLSPYAVSIDDDRVRLHRDAGSPQEVVFAAGVLQIDGEVRALSPGDIARVSDYERRVRGLLPEAKAVAHEAVDIAIDAVAAVARVFEAGGSAGDGDAFDVVAANLHRRVEAGFAAGSFDEAGVDAAIEAAMQEVIPRLVAAVTAQAVRVALSGDEAAAKRLEARASAMEAEIERAAEARAKGLERRVEALCDGVAALDAIEREWEVRHAGTTLDLVEVARVR